MIALMILIFFLLQGFILLCCAAAGNDAGTHRRSPTRNSWNSYRRGKRRMQRKKVGILCECIAFFIYSYSAVFTSSEIIEK